MTLEEALRAFRADHDLNARFSTMSAEAQRHYEWHDMMHILFGLGTAMRQEAQADGWTLLGTDITRRELRAFDALPEEKALIAELGWWAILKGYLRAVPDYVRIALRARKLSMKWRWSDNAEYRNWKVCDIRREFGIERALAG
jgi:hypothetical protein